MAGTTDTSPDLLLDYDPAGSLWGPKGTPIPTIDDCYLPFSRGALTFGSGMGVKMTVTRLQQVDGSSCEIMYIRRPSCKAK